MNPKSKPKDAPSSDKIVERAERLRALFASHNVDAFVIPSIDEFHNEFVPQHLRRLEWISGFTGSNGIAIISDTQAVLYTDGRYLLQARKQVPYGWEILDMNKPGGCSWFEHLRGKRLGYDPMLHTEPDINYYQKLSKKHQFNMHETANLVDKIRSHIQSLAHSPMQLELKYAGQATKDKIKAVVAAMHKEAEYLLVTAPDALSWLLNLRGHIIEYTPVILGYGLLHKDGRCTVFTDEQLPAIKGLDYRPWSDAVRQLAALAASSAVIQCDSDLAPVRLAAYCQIKQHDPCTTLKAAKNKVEQEGMRQAGIIDSAALCKFFYWLETSKEAAGVDELGAARKLLEIRAQHELFQMPSFPSISAFADNGAIIHYQPDRHNSKKIAGNGLYLLDSGGHYLCGTTDITRVISIGKPTKKQRLYYTLVLQGHINLARAVFPKGTKGMQLDALARAPLWRHNADYAHGTGHGVGHFLCVHEGPQRINKGSNASAALQDGMVLSNEPGYYKEGEYGIRLENLMLVQPTLPENSDFLRFEMLTWVPFDARLIDTETLNEDEIAWLAWYNSEIESKVAPLLDKREREWLSHICHPAA